MLAGSGEAIVTDATEAMDRDAKCEAADQFVDREHHRLLPVSAAPAAIHAAEVPSFASNRMKQLFETAIRWLPRDPQARTVLVSSRYDRTGATYQSCVALGIEKWPAGD